MRKGPVLINAPLHTETQTSAPSSAFFKSNQIPCALSTRPLSRECTLSKAQTCHWGRPYTLLKKHHPTHKHQSFAFLFFLLQELCLITGSAYLSISLAALQGLPEKQRAVLVASVLWGWRFESLKTKGLSFSFRGASDNLRGELVRDQVCGPRAPAAGRTLRAPTPWGGGITGSP